MLGLKQSFISLDCIDHWLNIHLLSNDGKHRTLGVLIQLELQSNADWYDTCRISVLGCFDSLVHTCDENVVQFLALSYCSVR